MGKDTNIQWCDSTVNPTSGCDGCELKVKGKPGTCYAVPIHENRLAKVFPGRYAADFHEVRTIAGRMAQTLAWSDLTGKSRPGKPWLDGMPRLIFVGDLGDVFSKTVPFHFLYDEIVRTARNSGHIYMILTKQPARMAEFGRWLAQYAVPWPTNLWVGTSVTNQITAGNRIPHLLATPAAVRFLSVEPMLGPIEFSNVSRRSDAVRQLGQPAFSGIHWVICGGESGSKARPFNVAWARDLRDQCKAPGVAFFMKQLGSNAVQWNDSLKKTFSFHTEDSHGGDMAEWPEDLRIRQFPTGLEAVHA